MTFNEIAPHLRKGKKAKLKRWDDKHIISEYHGVGAGGGWHILIRVNCKYSHYDQWQPVLEELESTRWELL